MSKEYRDETVKKYEHQIQCLIVNAPLYVQAYYQHMHNGKREITTQAAYVRDVIDFIKYEMNALPECKDLELKNFDVAIFDKLTVNDFNEYRSFLKDAKQIGNSSSKKKFSALSSFYKFLNTNGYINNNPMQDFEFPVVNKHRIIKLDAQMSNQLLSGILANDKYLLNETVIDIPEDIRQRRERLVLRNYAICCVFLGTGLRVSELVGLDLNDINFKQGTINIIAKGGDEIQVYFGDDVAKALKMYLNGLTLPENLSKYENTNEFEWIKSHYLDKNLKDKIRDSFKNCSESFYHDMELLASYFNRQGRASLNPAKNNHAVFVTTHGTRMSVRSVELMIKEMAKTYLPDYDDKDLFSPHKLRATCASRILTQTSDIQLASTQLNHKGIAVTAAFYAELQKEKQKDKIRNLDMNEW